MFSDKLSLFLDLLIDLVLFKGLRHGFLLESDFKVDFLFHLFETFR